MRFARLAAALLAAASTFALGCDTGAAHDAGVRDAGAPDAGPVDAGSADADSADAGSADAGSADAGFALDPAQLELARTLTIEPGAAPPPDPTNSVADDPAAAALGQALFFDARFSGALRSADNHCVNAPYVLGSAGQTGRVACAGCHVPGGDLGSSFVDTRSQEGTISLAAGWVLRRTPTVLDVAQSPLMMWDGRRDHLASVVFGALESADEMNSGRLFVAQQIHRLHRSDYEALFGPMPPLEDARFGALDAAEAGCRGEEGEPPVCRGMPGDGAEFDALSPTDQDAVTQVVMNAGKAIAAYLRLLGSRPARFDAFVAGEGDLGLDEQRGLALFVGRAGCIDCHSGPYLSDHAVHNVGLRPRTVAAVFIDIDDPGAAAGIEALLADRLSSTGPFVDGPNPARPTATEPTHLGAFRTPMLRGHAQQPSFFHTGHVRSLREAVEHFARGGDRYGFLGVSELADADGVPIDRGLSERDIDDLEAFLRTLDGPAPPAALRARPSHVPEPPPLVCP